MDCSSPGSPVHGIFQAGILEWVAIPFSRGSSQPRDRIWVVFIVGRFFTVWATGKILGQSVVINAKMLGHPQWIDAPKLQRSKVQKVKLLGEIPMDGQLPKGLLFAGFLLLALPVRSLGHCCPRWGDWGVGSEACYKVERGLTWRGPPFTLLRDDSWFSKPNFSIFCVSGAKNNWGGWIPITIRISYICVMLCPLESSFASVILLDPHINPMR